MIEKLKAIEAAATPGPWTNLEVWCDQNSGSDSTTEWKAYKADAKFVCIFRELMPEILTVLEAVHSITSFPPKPPTGDRGPDLLYVLASAMRALNEKASSMDT